jgi:hypothetical protein
VGLFIAPLVRSRYLPHKPLATNHLPQTTCHRPLTTDHLLQCIRLNLRTVNPEPLAQVTKLLLGRCASGGTKDHLCAKLPVFGDIPGLLDFGIDQRIVVLQINTKPPSFQGSPRDVLGHAVGVGGPGWELVGVYRVLILQAFNCRAGDKE